MKKNYPTPLSYEDVLNRLINKWLSQTKIMVTGPQRSGTTFAAFALAEDLGFKFIKETEYGIGNWEKFKLLLEKYDNFIVHAPALMHRIRELPQDMLIIIMYRNIQDIIKSQVECQWVYELEEKVKYFPYSKQIDCQQPISLVKYDFIINIVNQYTHMKDRIIWMDYESMSCHPEWIPSKNRTMDVRGHHDKESFKIDL